MSTTEIGRFKLVTDRRELALPSEDFFSGSITEDYYIDTDRDTDLGRINIGQRTAEQIAKLIGWVPGDYAQKLTLRNQELEEENDRLSDLIRSAHSAAIGLATALLSAPPDEDDASTIREPSRKSRSHHPAGKGVDGPVDESEFG
jgi:hypothetical protein